MEIMESCKSIGDCPHQELMLINKYEPVWEDIKRRLTAALMQGGGTENENKERSLMPQYQHRNDEEIVRMEELVRAANEEDIIQNNLMYILNTET